jgi:hypothetical protein
MAAAKHCEVTDMGASLSREARLGRRPAARCRSG